MKKLLASLFLSLVLLFSLGFVLNSKVLADDPTATPTPRLKQVIRQDIKDVRQDINSKLPAKGASPSGVRQRLCDLHLKNVKDREVSVGTRGLIMLTRFNAISTAVENYYTNKLVPAGKTISNYDALVADISTKKAALQPLVDKVKADSSVLTCDGGRATGQFKTFRTDAQALLQGLKNYRQSVINLVKAVRAIAPNDQLSPTPTVEESPSPTPGI